MARNAALRITRNTVALAIGRVSAPLFSFILVIYAARLLGVNDFGKYALIQTYFQLFLGLCVNGLSIGITREIAKKPDWVSRYLSTSVVLVSVLALVSSGILIMLTHALYYAPDTKAAVYLTCLALLPAANSMVFEAAFVAFEKAEYVTYGAMLENTLRIIFSLIALFQGYGLLALFMIMIVTRVFLLLFDVIFFNWHVSKLHWYFEWGFLKRLALDWTVFALESWLFRVFYSLDVIVLSLFHGELAVGLYAAAYKILSPGSVVATSFTSALFPHMSRLFEESKATFQQISQEILKYMLVIILPGVVTIAFLADRIIALLYTNAYVDSIPILRVLIWVLIPMFLNPFLSYILFARGEQRKALQIAAISLAFYTVICLWFIPRWGGVGAAWAFLLALSAAFGLYLVFVLGDEEAIRTLLIFGRTILATVGFSIFILVLRNIHLVPLLGSAMVLYGILLIVFRVPSSRDIALFRGMMLKGLRRVGTILGRV